MNNTIERRVLNALCMFACILLLSGCGASVKVDIDSHSPSNSSVLYVNPGDTTTFTATGPSYSPYSEALLQVGVRAQWEVYEYAPDEYLAGPVLNILPRSRTGTSLVRTPATSVNANAFSFTAPDTSIARYYLVTYSVFRHNIGGVWEFADSSRSWLLYAGEHLQAPPQWEGDFLISTLEDISRLQEYTEINGTLSVMPFTPDTPISNPLGGENLVIATTRVDNRELKYSLPLGIRAESSLITQLNVLEGINNITGNLYLFSNNALQGFNGLSGLRSVGGHVMAYNNSLIGDLDGFQNIGSIGGDLYIQSNSSLESTSALQGLQAMDGAVVIAWNSKLSDVSGLSNLATVGGRFDITGADALTSLNSLSNLNSVGGDVIIKDNDQLTSLSGLETLTLVGENLIIDNNSTLETLQHLSNLDAVHGVSIKSNSVLENLNGLDNLTAVNGSVTIQYHESLSSIDALGKIHYIGGDLSIDHNYILPNLVGLESLTRIDRSLNIQQNFELTTIDSLSNLEYVSSGFHIKNNSKLCDSEAQSLYDLVLSRDGVNSDIVVITNDSDC